MPELPEVETIVKDLDKRLKGKKISRVEVRDAKVLNLGMKKFIKEVAGTTVKSVKRRAKMIIFDLGKKYILIHLKMTGQLVLISKKEKIAGGHPITHEEKIFPNKFTRAVFEFGDFSGGGPSSKAAQPLKLYFNDVRRFGWIKLADKEGLDAIVRNLGIEPLSSDFIFEKFYEILSRKKKTAIKQALMDQKYLAGIGNIYSDEALFDSGLNPFRKSGSLSREEAMKLWRSIPKILKFAVKHRGTSFSDYVDAKGEMGSFVKYLKVYGRAGEKCRKCGSIIQKKKLGGRSAQWCDVCQK